MPPEQGSKTVTYAAGPDDAPKRLDRLVLQLLPALSRGALLKALRIGRIRLNGRKAGGDVRVQEGDVLEFDRRLWEEGRPEAETTRTGDRTQVLDPHWILFRNQDLLVLNKPRGWDTQGTRSLDTLVKAYLGSREDSLSFRPGPLHRLDTNTSGVLCFSASLAGAQNFSAMLQAGVMSKAYVALLKGDLKAPLVVNSTLERDFDARITREGPEGKPARTTFLPLKKKGEYTLALCLLDTGRTHQIRAQASAAGLPLAGDGRYGGGHFPGGFVLHSFLLRFPPTGTYSWPQEFQAPLPSASVRQLLGALQTDREELGKILEGGLAAARRPL